MSYCKDCRWIKVTNESEYLIDHWRGGLERIGFTRHTCLRFPQPVRKQPTDSCGEFAKTNEDCVRRD